MSTTADKLNKVLETKAAIKDAIIAKGVDVADTDSFSSYAGKIGEIQSGGSSSYYGLTDADILGYPDENGSLHYPEGSLNVNLKGIKDISITYAFNYKFSKNESVVSFTAEDLETISGANFCFQHTFSSSGIQELHFPKLTQVSGNQIFMNCCLSSSIKVVDFPMLTETGSGSGVFSSAFKTSVLETLTFPSLITAGTSAFSGACQQCSRLKSVSFPSLTSAGQQSFNTFCMTATNLENASFPVLETIDGYGCFQQAFNGCSKMTSMTFPSLRTISGYATFKGNTNFTYLSFPELTAINNTNTSTSNGTFYGCSALQRIDLPKLTTIPEKFMFNSCGKLTEIHFGAENQAAIEASAGYSNLWGRGAGYATVYFDL